MSRRVVKIAITGTHSTGKSSFLDALEPRLVDLNLKVGRLAIFRAQQSELAFRS
ncbi:hypothetical protein I3J27_35175 [Bradyrhizobium xenonodulans]|uniref:NadR/Ttd14 AAA domain-containing protein n=1 Tax=Bradyrhizobium xenonodulans TaxID=2736875 RepID=A0ABY7MKJ6_9BRAD|nr:hypothetical protein [Bradyrhizobium xenonodulans]WBL78131.1 hypothetical protein I3J27_35175 [Bradyrhizobium xenonodulans]